MREQHEMLNAADFFLKESVVFKQLLSGKASFER